MFVMDIFRELDDMRYRSQPFINVPLSNTSYARSEIYAVLDKLREVFFRDESVIHPGRLNVGLCFEDPLNWIIGILALRYSSFVSVPIPLEFTQEQIASFAPNLDLILADSERTVAHLSKVSGKIRLVERINLRNGKDLFLLKAASADYGSLRLSRDAISVIHTSGSTSHPKGVVIGENGLNRVVGSMADRLFDLDGVHYVSILPFSLLLEQVLGIYIPILSRGSVSVLPPSIPSYTGTQRDLTPYFDSIKKSQANFGMVPPSFLSELRSLCISEAKKPKDFIGHVLKVLATGGAPVDKACLEFFKENDLDIFQGYGLSENTSVVSWSYPDSNILGSVGKPLEHNEVRIDLGGKIEVRGESLYLGYVKDGAFSDREGEWLKTGDHGFFDETGALHITGRDANLIVLSSGRNVAPEWIESRLKIITGVKDLILIGHGRPYLSAIVLVDENKDTDEIVAEVRRFADGLGDDFPEFARIKEFIGLKFKEKYYSVSGRLLRHEVHKECAGLINAIYDERTNECKTISL